MRFYVATSVENRAAADELADLLIAAGWKQTHRWTAVDPVLEGSDEHTRRAIALADLGGVLLADLVVVLAPGRRGTHAELGAALATGKRVVLVADSPESLRSDGVESPFYAHPLVERVYGSVQDAAEYLVHTDVQTVRSSYR